MSPWLSWLLVLQLMVLGTCCWLAVRLATHPLSQLAQAADALGPDMKSERLPEDGPEPRLELTFNHGRTEPYELGTGYGHIAITAEDLDAALARLAELGIEPEKPPYSVREGGSRLCFVKDPDGYRIEIIESS